MKFSWIFVIFGNEQKKPKTLKTICKTSKQTNEQIIDVTSDAVSGCGTRMRYADAVRGCDKQMGHRQRAKVDAAIGRGKRMR